MDFSSASVARSGNAEDEELEINYEVTEVHLDPAKSEAPPKPVSFTFNQSWAVTSPSSINSLLCHFSHLQHIHSINMKSRASVGFFDLRIGCSPQMRHTDCPQIILNDKYNWQLPQSCHVQALKELAIVSCSISKEGA
ncbi:hypothetical protein Leryth_010491, partial [Lithospermum erythrorhizon]